MNDSSFLKLSIAYGYLLVLFLSSAFLSIPSHVRDLLFLTAFVGLIIVHVSAWRNTPVRVRKESLLLTVGWGIQLVIFMVYTGFHIFLQRHIAFLGWLSIFSQLILLIIIAFSFILQTPFWYIETRNVISRVIGILALILLTVITVSFGLAFIEDIRGVSPFIIKKELSLGGNRGRC